MSQGISWVIWEIQFNAPPHRVRRTAATASLILATIKASVPFGHWKTETFIAGLRHDGLVAPFVINCPMNRKIFEAYIETQLAPTLEPGDVVSRVAEQKHRARDDAIFDRGAKGIVHRQITTVSQTKHFAPAFIRIPAQTGQHDRGNGFVAGGIALFRPGKDLEEICPDQNHCELSDACGAIHRAFLPKGAA